MVTDALLLSEKACVLFELWPRRTSGGMVSCVVHVLTVGMRRLTLPQESFRATCFGLVLCTTIMFGQNTKKEGLRWKTAMKKRKMMTTIDLCSLNTLITQWKT